MRGLGFQLVTVSTHGNHDPTNDRFPQPKGARSWRAPRRPPVADMYLGEAIQCTIDLSIALRRA
jgi:hypothetical protein